MGHWGTSISGNDTFMGVYENFFHLYNHDLPITEIKEKLAAHYAETLSNAQTSNDYWFALAKALWECKVLDKETLDRVKKIVEDKLDLKVWKELEAKEKDLKAREKVLDKFLAMISVEKEKARARKKITYYSGLYPKGTCLAVTLPNGNYSGLLVIDQELETTGGENLLTATDINTSRLPTLDDFNNANILTGEMENMSGQPVEIFLLFVMEGRRKRNNKEASKLFREVGILPIPRVFEKYFETPYQYKDDWSEIAREMEKALAEKANGKPTVKSATVSSWIS